MPRYLQSAICVLGALTAPFVSAKDWDSPPYRFLYQFEMPIAPIKQPLRTFNFPNAPPIDYYEIDVKPFESQIYPNLKKTRLVGYDGQAPGPTIMIQRGRESVVRFLNHADRPNSVHLHGSYSRAPFDGWAEDTLQIGQYKDYYYPNSQNGRTLWYHDHAVAHTAENSYFGQAGFYLIRDPEEQNMPGLPQGKYDIPISLTSKRYNEDGSLWSPEANEEVQNLFGDIIQVNGQPWPFLRVEPRKYRLRFLNSAVSRTFEMYFQTPSGSRANMKVVGSDSGLLLNPVDTTQLDTSVAERWEVVFDFAPFKGQNVTLRSNADIADNDKYLHTDKIMRFVVGNTVSDTSNNGDLPAKLRDVDFPPDQKTVSHEFQFERQGGQWVINGVTWEDGPEKRVLAKPQRGAVENWILKNGAGGWTHPIHMHLIDFQIVSRRGGTRNNVLPYEKVALKDVVWLNKNEEVNVIARYAPWDGLYMFHCHNLIHEDHDMMAAFNVTALSDLGYDEKTTFLDPMEPRYRPKSFSDADFQGRTGDFSPSAIEQKVAFFSNLEAYRNVGAVQSRLEAYWKTASANPGGAASSTLQLGNRVCDKLACFELDVHAGFDFYACVFDDHTGFV
ncbi:hypothetical protein WHR41_05946 [Cladosporium halotolerans]|uniref:Bilirubin oxidase n=1 Tax=Cladosporium halotolerans TaxID=1052096 RepID=A0AB34KLT5_9PEZI